MRWKLLAALVAAGIIASLLFVCNPLMVFTVDGSTDDTASLEETYSRVTPYARMKHMMLTDSGYYTVTKDGQIRSRFYMADLGGQQCFVELSQGFLENYSQTDVLEDVSAAVKLVPSDDIAALAASDLGMDTGQYRSAYSISSVAASEYRNNIAGVYIYYALALLLAIGIICRIMRSAKTDNYKRKTGGL